MPALLQKCCCTEGDIGLRPPGIVPLTLPLTFPTSDILLLAKGIGARKGVLHYGSRRRAQRCQALRAEPSPTDPAQPSRSLFPPCPWHRTPFQPSLDLSVPVPFSSWPFCILPLFTLLTPKLAPSAPDSCLGRCAPSTQSQSEDFTLLIHSLWHWAWELRCDIGNLLKWKWKVMMNVAQLKA